MIDHHNGYGLPFRPVPPSTPGCAHYVSSPAPGRPACHPERLRRSLLACHLKPFLSTRCVSLRAPSSLARCVSLRAPSSLTPCVSFEALSLHALRVIQSAWPPLPEDAPNEREGSPPETRVPSEEILRAHYGCLFFMKGQALWMTRNARTERTARHAVLTGASHNTHAWATKRSR